MVLTAGSHDGQHLSGSDVSGDPGEDLTLAGRAGHILKLEVHRPLLANRTELRPQLRTETHRTQNRSQTQEDTSSVTHTYWCQVVSLTCR